MTSFIRTPLSLATRFIRARPLVATAAISYRQLSSAFLKPTTNRAFINPVSFVSANKFASQPADVETKERITKLIQKKPVVLFIKGKNVPENNKPS